MMQIIREHNVLTGYRFVTFEYLAVSLVLAVLGAYYVAAARWLDAAVWFGIVANCLVIAGFAAAALRAGAADYGSLPMLRRAFRRQIALEHPHLGRHTVILVTITFIPLLLVLLVTATHRDGNGLGDGRLRPKRS